MTNKTPCRNLGYYVGNKFEVHKDIVCTLSEQQLYKGDIVSLYRDDHSVCPRFEDENGNFWWIPLDDVKLIYEHKPEQEPKDSPNKYIRTISGVDLDVYDILKAWDVTCPATQHAIKKLLMPGQRGHKNKLNDLEEAHAAIQRAIELEAF